MSITMSTENTATGITTIITTMTMRRARPRSTA